MSYINHRDFGGAPRRPDKQALLNTIRLMAVNVVALATLQDGPDLGVARAALVRTALTEATYFLEWDMIEPEDLSYAELESHHAYLKAMFEGLLEFSDGGGAGDARA